MADATDTCSSSRVGRRSAALARLACSRCSRKLFDSGVVVSMMTGLITPPCGVLLFGIMG
jgi:hypothetical protein